MVYKETATCCLLVHLELLDVNEKAMKKVSVICATLGALIGVGGAYANGHSEIEKTIGVTYNWYLPSGELAFIAVVTVAKAICPAGVLKTCLRGTATGMQSITLFWGP